MRPRVAATTLLVPATTQRAAPLRVPTGPRLVSVTLLVASMVLGVAAAWGRLDSLDRALLPRADATSGWSAITHLGDTLVWLGVAAGAAMVLWGRRGRLDGVAMVGLAAAAWALTWGMKYAIGRDRPPGVVDPASPAFPSGHALGATAAYVGAVVLAAPRNGPAIAFGVSLAALVGWSRVALGVHHPSDVLGGWLAGAGLVIAAHDLRSSIRARRDASPRREAPRGGPPRPGAP